MDIGDDGHVDDDLVDRALKSFKRHARFRALWQSRTLENSVHIVGF